MSTTDEKVFFCDHPDDIYRDCTKMTAEMDIADSRDETPVSKNRHEIMEDAFALLCSFHAAGDNVEESNRYANQLALLRNRIKAVYATAKAVCFAVR